MGKLVIPLIAGDGNEYEAVDAHVVEPAARPTLWRVQQPHPRSGLRGGSPDPSRPYANDVRAGPPSAADPPGLLNGTSEGEP